MSAILDTVPCIDVTKDGTTYHLPIQVQESRDGNSRPIPVVRAPKLALPPPISIAPPDGGGLRRNYDIDEMTLIDWSRGMSVDRYPTTAPPSGYGYGDLDSRTSGYLTPPPLATDLSTPNPGLANRILEANYTNARLFHWTPSNSASRYNPTVPVWVTLQTGGNNMALSDMAVGLRKTWAVGVAGGTYAVYRTTNGTAWDAMAKGAMTAPSLVAVFDERLWALDTVSGTATLYQSVDIAGAAAGAGTWTAGNTFTVTGPETTQRLFVWMYPLDRGKPTLWCLTGARLLYYDYYAATPTWKVFHTFRSPFTTFSVANVSDAHVWAKNNNLYTCCSYDEYITEFTGSTVTQIRTNAQGGLPSARRLTPNCLGGDDDHLYIFCGVSATDAAAPGAVVAMNEGGTIHSVYRPTGATQVLAGGGVGYKRVWVGRYDTSGPTLNVLEIDTTDATIAPHLTTKRNYASGSFQTVTGWLHGNLINVNKRLLYFEVDCIKADGTPGLDTGCTLQIEYARRGASFVSAGTLTASDTFPAVLAIAGGYTFKELQLRITETRGSNAAQAPFLHALKVGFRPRPKRRNTYTARVDLRDDAPAFRTPDKKYRGYTASKLRQVLDELDDSDDAGLDDTLVGLAYGGNGNSLHPRRRSVPQCEITIQSQESATHADGLFLLQFSDVSAPNSG